MLQTMRLLRRLLGAASLLAVLGALLRAALRALIAGLAARRGTLGGTARLAASARTPTLLATRKRDHRH